ncbi:MAG: hypothetical protein CMN32_12065 [Saprospirales bacterium]|nr:hypothetical protein [Saprospirales bacterium]
MGGSAFGITQNALQSIWAGAELSLWQSQVAFQKFLVLLVKAWIFFECLSYSDCFCQRSFSVNE